MKYIIFFILFFILSKQSDCQISKVKIKEGPFLNAVNWYLETTMNHINSLPIKTRVNSFSELGFVEITFYNKPDSMVDKEIPGSILRDVTIYSRSQFKIGLGSGLQKGFAPPNFYFIHKGIVVFIFTGLESFIDYTEKDIIHYPKELIWNRKFVLFQGSKEYLIKLDKTNKDGFLPIDLEGKPLELR
jgi:hypothetical protein